MPAPTPDRREPAREGSIVGTRRRAEQVRARPLAAILAVALLAGACTGAHREHPRPAPSAPRYASGGTLRIGVPTTFSPFTTSRHILDPQKDYFSEPWELFRCCLLRTLLSFDGRQTDQGGTILRPDLATQLPEVSRTA